MPGACPHKARDHLLSIFTSRLASYSHQYTRDELAHAYDDTELHPLDPLLQRCSVLVRWEQALLAEYVTELRAISETELEQLPI